MMKFYDQKTFGKTDGGCFNACLGSIVKMAPDDIPFFIARGELHTKAREEAKRHGG